MRAPKLQKTTYYIAKSLHINWKKAYQKLQEYMGLYEFGKLTTGNVKNKRQNNIREAMISPALFSSKKTWYKWTYDVKRKEMEKAWPACREWKQRQVFNESQKLLREKKFAR